MISKLTVGKFYNIVGTGKWKSFNQDLKIMSQTKASTVEEQEIPIYEEWYDGYGIEESFYHTFLADNGPVYMCKKVESRDPSIINDGEEIIYIFPDIVDFSASSELIVGKTYSWELRTKPYKEQDAFNPMSILPTNILSIVNGALRPYLFDSIAMYRDEIEVIITEEDWISLNAERERIKKEIDLEQTRASDEDSRQRSEMYMRVTTIETDKEKLRLKLEESSKIIMVANQKYQENASRERLLMSQEQRLRSIHTSMAIMASNINQHLPPESQIKVPPFDELSNA
jgi:hypothetical protein